MKVIMTGGGTGGHIYPAIAIADKLKELDKDTEVLFVGTERGLEKTIVPKNGYDIKFITVSGFNRKNLLKNFKTIKDLLKGSLQAKKIIKEFKPDVVIGTGGYVCGPVVREGHKYGAKTYIHEQNAYPGVTNKMLEQHVNKIFISFEEAGKYFKNADKLIMSGNPVRKNFYNADAKAAREKLSIGEDDFVLLSFGGSQGAGKINAIMLEMLERFKDEENVQMIFATGKYYYEEMKKTLAERGLDARKNIRVIEYIDEMDTYLAAADAVISRSGALTVSEITVCGRASIMIPSPNVTGNHQYFNAKSVADKGGAMLIEEKDAEAELVYKNILKLKEDKIFREEMEKCSKAAAPQDAAGIIGDYVIAHI